MHTSASDMIQQAGHNTMAHHSHVHSSVHLNRHHPSHHNHKSALSSSSAYGTVSAASSSSSGPALSSPPLNHPHLHQHNQQHSNSNTSSSSSSSSSPPMHQKDCIQCWSNATTLNHNSNTYAKSRTIRLRRTEQNSSLGFSIRGGWEHGIGFYVSEVQQQSLAAKKGLCPGDQILQINGFPLDRVVHDEVVALIRMSSNDLILRVRSAGIVPHKDRPGEQLTWKRLQVAIAAAAAGNGATPHNHNHHHHHLHHLNIVPNGTASASSEVSSFVYARPRSAASDSFTPSSSSTSSEDIGLCDHLLHQHHTSSEECDLTSSPPLHDSSASMSLYKSYSEKQLYIRCHQAGSSLGCSVVNGPLNCPGIFVQNVKEGKLAAKCGLEIGDQIVKVNNVDVSAIGFDGAITLLKSLTNLSLLVRKGVARHIFQCRDQYHLFGSSKDVCHFSHQQQTYSSAKSLVKSPSESTLYYPTSSSLSSPKHHPSSSPSYSAYYHHHQYKTIQTTSPVLKCSNNLSSNAITSTEPTGHFCSAAYSTVQISSAPSGNVVPSGGSTCDKSRCCCKRQRTVTDAIVYEPTGAPNPLIASTCSSCTLVMNNQQHHHGHPHSDSHNHHGVHHGSAISIQPPAAALAPAAIFSTDSTHLDQVTSAMANSIRILQEVREKEEKLVEASRKLNEEHQKLCREKEKFKLYDFTEKQDQAPVQLPHPPPPPVMVDSEFDLSINSQYSTISTAPLGGSTATTSGGESSSISSSISGRVIGGPGNGPTFSFLEEIKALGVNGTKRHLRPVNSNDLNGGGSSLESKDKDGTISSDKSKLLRRLPFGIANANGTGASSKEAESKQKQHELLMEEFRIAHQRMFGGKENNGTLLSKIKLVKCPTVPKEEHNSVEVSQVNKDNNSSETHSKVHQPTGTNIPKQNHTNRTHVTKSTKDKQVNHSVTRSSITPSNSKVHQSESLSSNAVTNRITIKVLSPKIGT